MNEVVQAIQAAVVSIIRRLSGRVLGAQHVRRFQVIDINVPANTTAGTQIEVDTQLDREFNRIVGIAFFQVTDGGIPGNYNVGARSNRRTWVDDININAWNANENVGPMEKYIETDIPYGSGDTWYARVVPNAAVDGDGLDAQMVLILEKTLTELPK